MKNEVIALVVSYNGGEDLVKTAAALVAQVKKILILDNGSDASNQNIISTLAIQSNVSVIKFDSNTGIGFALNRGVDVARAEGFDWVLTMDQDSVASPKMIEEMTTSAKKNTGMNVLCPTLQVTDSEEFQGHDQVVGYSITSGNLIPIEIFDAIGGFNEKYFIDSVDFEFSLRLRNAGFKMIRCGRAKLKHKLGESVFFELPVAGYRYTSHSPLRRYYIFRNHLYLISDFWRKNPFFLAKKSVVLIYLFFEILFFDSKKKENLKMICLGLRDFATGKAGRFGK